MALSPVTPGMTEAALKTRIENLVTLWGGTTGSVPWADVMAAVNLLAARFDCAPIENLRPMSHFVERINAIIAASNARTIIQDTLGSKLRLLGDLWHRPDLTTVAGGLVSEVKDVVAGVAFIEATNRPSVTNAGRVIMGDGVAATLATTSMAWGKTSNFSCFGVLRCDLDAAADTAIHAAFSFGQNLANGVAIRRHSQGGFNVLAANVSGTTSSMAAASARVDGAATWWLDVRTTNADFYVNGVLVVTFSVTPSITLSRARLLAGPNPAAAQFAKLGLALFGFSDLASEPERIAVMAVLADIASQVTA